MPYATPEQRECDAVQRFWAIAVGALFSRTVTTMAPLAC